MSDEELRCFYFSEGMDREKFEGELMDLARREWLIKEITDNRYWKTFSGRLYLLSIGVYPFDQDSPKDVIWRYENE